MSAVPSGAAAALAACVEAGGVAVFPADTVYGLACDPANPDAVARLYELKGRPAGKPAAVMWFDRERMLAALPQLGPRTRAAVEALTPGGVTLLVPDPDGLFPLATGAAAPAPAPPTPAPPAPAPPTPAPPAPAPAPPALGVRVPVVPLLAGARVAVLQSSANLAGGPDARSLDEVPEAIRAGADLVLDAGPLPGTPSTVVDLSAYERTGAWTVAREGAVATAEVARSLAMVGRP